MAHNLQKMNIKRHIAKFYSKVFLRTLLIVIYVVRAITYFKVIELLG